MQNKLKPQSLEVIQQLRTANIKCVMVTGEYFTCIQTNFKKLWYKKIQ